MSDVPSKPRAPTAWLDSLHRSKAQLAAGMTVPLLPILERLRATAERLETESDPAEVALPSPQ